ncbi:MAG: shikimate kinase [Spirochaetaceae bacterium]|jgi:shikimate kinase|nr:shikimate kinase [Spirochaetaceae bacterium]
MPLLVLTGPKHSGKTSAGHALRDVLGGEFVDIDALVEEREGQPVRDLYRLGREVFRQAEAKALASVVAASSPGRTVIVAAGGGLIDNEAAVKMLTENSLAVIFYLDVAACTAWNRIAQAARNGEGLPAFLDTENPMADHAALHGRRSAAYKKLARYTVDAEGKTPAQIAAQIAAHYAELPASQ